MNITMIHSTVEPRSAEREGFFAPRVLKAGQTYDVASDVGTLLVKRGQAAEATEKKPAKKEAKAEATEKKPADAPKKK